MSLTKPPYPHQDLTITTHSISLTKQSSPLQNCAVLTHHISMTTQPSPRQNLTTSTHSISLRAAASLFGRVDTRDALAKAIYALLFDWLILQLNQGMRPQSEGQDGAATELDDGQVRRACG